MGSGKYQGAGRGSCASEQWGKRGEKTRRKDSADSGRPTPGRCRRKQVSASGGGEGGARARAAPVPPAEPGPVPAPRPGPGRAAAAAPR